MGIANNVANTNIIAVAGSGVLNVSSRQSNLPVSQSCISLICNRQGPKASSPSNSESRSRGLNEPIKGALASAIESSASSSNRVCV